MVRVYGGPPINTKSSQDLGRLAASSEQNIRYTSFRPAPAGPCLPAGKIITQTTSGGVNPSINSTVDANGRNSSPLQPYIGDNITGSPGTKSTFVAGEPSAYDFYYYRIANGKPLVQHGDEKLVIDWGPKGGVISFTIANLVYQGRPDF